MFSMVAHRCSESGAPQPVGGCVDCPARSSPGRRAGRGELERLRVSISRHCHLVGDGGSHDRCISFVQYRRWHSALLLWVSGSRMGHGYCRGHQLQAASVGRGVAGPGRGGGWIRYFCNCGCPGSTQRVGRRPPSRSLTIGFAKAQDS